MPAHLIDISNKRFGMLIALRREGAQCPAKWLCQCECGRKVAKDGFRLRQGAVKSCGCSTRDLIAQSRRSHGMTGSRLEYIRRGMIARCHFPHRKDYPRYGGKGIHVCSEWLEKPEAFYDWAQANGYQDSLSIDRIDSKKDYSPENCQWIPLSENIVRANRARGID